MATAALAQSQFAKWITDVRAYEKDLLKIQSVDKGLVNFSLNEIQSLFYDILDDIKSKGRLVRVVVLKARREGISTATAGRFFHGVANRPSKYAMMITHEPDASEFIFGMHKRFYQHLPDVMKPTTKYNNLRKLEFNKPNGKGLDSAIRVATAGKEDIGSGQLIHLCHLSELSKWPTHTSEGVLTSVLQCVPKEPDTEVIIESTAKGIGGKFFEYYKSARYKYIVYLDDNKVPRFRCEINPDADESNEWSAIFFPWFAFHKYTMKIDPGFKMTEAEAKMKALYNLSTQQVMWRRWSIQNNCGGSEQMQCQEYPSNDFEAFVSTGSPVFDTVKLLQAITACKPPVARYECQFGTGNFVSDAAGSLQVWREPVPGRSYVVSADVSEGIEVASDNDERSKYDSSVLDVVDQLSGEQVAHWQGKMAPDLFAQLLFHVARRYNMAWLAPERNNHGGTVVLKLFDMGYKKLYVEKVPDPPNKPRKRYGFHMSNAKHSGVKFMIMDGLSAEIREGTHGINCRETLNEMLSFKRDPDGGMGAEKGMHDDRVVSIAIAKFVRTRLPMPSGLQRRPEDVWSMPAQAAPPPSTRGWM